MKDISIGIWITIGVFLLMAIVYAKQLWKEWKAGRESSTDDLLHNLNYKIENAMMDNQTELVLLRSIKKFKQRPDIDQKRLKKLEDKFRRRYSKLHEMDTFSDIDFDYSRFDGK